MNVIFTVCNRHTYFNAVVLAESVKNHMPSVIFYLCWVDNLAMLPSDSDLKIIAAEDVGIPDWEAMCARYYDFELVAACRPWFGRYLLSKLDVSDTLTFLSPTTWLLGPIAPISIDTELMLKVNISKPLTNDERLDDKRILNVGMYHSGAWIARNTEVIQRFFEWWSVRTIDRAKFDLCSGMCMDQLWLNYAPVWIPAVHLNRDASWHYGLHSILNHELVFSDQLYLVDNHPIVSVDFAGMEVFDPVWSRHRLLTNHSKVFQLLFSTYKKELKRDWPQLKVKSAPGFGMAWNMKLPGPIKRRSIALLENISQFIDEL